MTEPQYYAVKVMFPAESIEIQNRIEWCKENNIPFFNVSINGCFINGTHYTDTEMKKIGTLVLGDNVAEIDLQNLPPKNIGMGFVFNDELDAIAFKLRWI